MEVKIEKKRLNNWALSVFIFLSLIIIICGFLICLLKELQISIIFGCILAGILGCSSAALLSSLDRKAHGWELEDGDKYPAIKKSDIESEEKYDKDKREMFSMRMLTFFYFRPLLGIIAALLIFFGFGNFENGSSEFTKNESNLIFWSLLAGLFAKSLIEKMKNWFDNLIGNK